MRSTYQSFDFPKQRIPNSEKDAAWGANCCDWVIAQGQSMRDAEEIELMYSILNGDIPEEAYRKVINPYNSTEEKYKRLPATMRNYDMHKGIIRRFVSEYIKGNHDFIVGANNPEVILAKNNKLQQELSAIVQQQIAVEINKSYQQWINQGQAPEEFKPAEALDVNKFISDFNKNYIDDISAQGQEILNVIKDITEDALLYARAYFDFVSFGRTFTYADVIGKDLIKRNILVKDAYPIRTDQFFVEDDDAFACLRRLTYQQIADEFEPYLVGKKKEFLDSYYARTGNGSTAELAYSVYESFFPEICKKHGINSREIFKSNTGMARESNTGLYDVWHVVWKGSVRQALVTYINEASFIDTRIENDDYEINTARGDISVEYVYQTQVYESTRIGGRNDAIYPYDARPIAFNRDGKLPYNGITELMPGLGAFSIIKTITPYNVFYNIVAFHREMAIAKNRMSILMIAKSLLGKVPENTIHKMLADGVLYYDDETDAGAVRAQQVRMLQSSNSDYIVQLGNILVETEQAAKMQVDMTPQRYGEIANSAGKGTTDEAINRGSMGSVIIEFVMDFMRERDYARDMDFSKLAWIDGLDTSYRDNENNVKYVSLDVDKHNYASYLIKAKSAANEREKLQQYRQLAFNASQNGDMDMATAAIDGDNVAAISKLIKQYKADKQAYETNLKELEQQTEQMRQDWELKKITLEGEEQRKTEELKGIIEAEIQLIKADANMISFDNGISPENKQAGLDRLDANRNAIEREKIALDKNKSTMDAFAKFQDRQLKNKDIDTKLEIAKQNKNRYDFKARKAKKK